MGYHCTFDNLVLGMLFGELVMQFVGQSSAVPPLADYMPLKSHLGLK